MAQDNVDVVQSAWDAFGRGDIDAVLDAIAPSAETRVPETLPWGGTYAARRGSAISSPGWTRTSSSSAPRRRRSSAPTTTT